MCESAEFERPADPDDQLDPPQDAEETPLLVIAESELAMMKRWVKKYPHIETGGDIFGCWLDESMPGSARIRLSIGPGHGVTRTAVSFYQDNEYLGDVGTVVVDKYNQIQVDASTAVN